MAFSIKVIVNKDIKGLVKDSVYNGYISSDGILIPKKDEWILISRGECKILDTYKKVIQ